jgi:Mor family transcriptional regulator
MTTTDKALAAVARATTAISKAEQARDRAITAAHEAGAQVTAIAEAAALSRPTVYSIIRRAQ